MLMKLGKKPAVHDSRTLKLANYLAATLPPTPVSCDWTKKVPGWPMYLNDQIGDCAIAMVGHQTQAWSFSDSDSLPTTPTEQQVLTGYEHVGGYRPGDPSTDNGCIMLDVLKAWRKSGLCGNKISAFAAVDHANHNHVKLAVELFGGILIGAMLPEGVQGASEWKAPKSPSQRVGPWEAGSWGGHAINVVKFDSTGLWVVTWGGLLKMSWTFWDAYVDESYCAISSLFFGKDMVAPNHLNLNAVIADLQAIAA